MAHKLIGLADAPEEFLFKLKPEMVYNVYLAGQRPRWQVSVRPMPASNPLPSQPASGRQ